MSHRQTRRRDAPIPDPRSSVFLGLLGWGKASPFAANGLLDVLLPNCYLCITPCREELPITTATSNHHRQPAAPARLHPLYLTIEISGSATGKPLLLLQPTWYSVLPRFVRRLSNRTPGPQVCLSCHLVACCRQARMTRNQSRIRRRRPLGLGSLPTPPTTQPNPQQRRVKRGPWRNKHPISAVAGSPTPSDPQHPAATHIGIL